jgi:hypothetical protein
VPGGLRLGIINRGANMMTELGKAHSDYSGCRSASARRTSRCALGSRCTPQSVVGKRAVEQVNRDRTRHVQWNTSPARLAHAECRRKADGRRAASVPGTQPRYRRSGLGGYVTAISSCLVQHTSPCSDTCPLGPPATSSPPRCGKPRRPC